MAYMTGSNQYQTKPQPPVPVPATCLLAQAASTSKSRYDDYPGHPLYGMPQEILAAARSKLADMAADIGVAADDVAPVADAMVVAIRPWIQEKPSVPGAPTTTVPPELRSQPAIQIDGRFVRMTPGELRYNAEVLLPRAQWASPSLLRGVAAMDHPDRKNLVLAHPSCSPRLAESILGKVTQAPPGGWDADVRWMELRVITADNQTLPVDLRRRCLSEVLQSRHPSVYTLRALMHPLSTTEMQLAATEEVLVDGAGYMLNAKPEFWAQLPATVSRNTLNRIVRGPACPKAFRAMVQLAAGK